MGKKDMVPVDAGGVKRKGKAKEVRGISPSWVAPGPPGRSWSRRGQFGGGLFSMHGATMPRSRGSS